MKGTPKMKHGIGNAFLLRDSNPYKGKTKMAMGPSRKSKSGKRSTPQGKALGPQK